MQEQLIKRAKELLADGTVQKVVGWQKGLFDEDVTPAVFASAEELDKGFVFNKYCAANLSKYLVKIIRIPCSCRLNPLFILRAFQRGADGVILCGCHPGDCHYSTGNYFARRRMTLLFSMLDFLGIERGRTRVEWCSAAEGVRFAGIMNDFVKQITDLGECKKLEDVRCKNN